MIKKLLYIIESLLIGIISIILLNLVFNNFDSHIPLNLLGILLIGFLRIIGLIIYLIFLLF